MTIYNLSRAFVLAVAVTISFSVTAQVKVGDNPGVINSSAILEIESTNRGFLPPRVNLLSETDATTIVNPAKGLLVYNSGTALKEGMYVNNGTSSAPIWSAVNFSSSSDGKLSFKQRLVQADPNVTINVGDYSFRYSLANSAGGVWQIRNNKSTSSSITNFVLEFWPPSNGSNGVSTVTLAPNTWTQISISPVNGTNELNIHRIFDTDSGKLFIFEGMLIQKGAVIQESMICDVY
ncbi:hypothetical protein [Flectobacillus roseus]|uniref:CBM-cenC domain-containing protein n=1 Tax=Flectobacillus roseus TaxID=502259 RepID=A0ABT6Y6V8_9BACT|nr:hypothetical protein [Flectobacillus roseus]MDI9858986.1 hypothetical protein [Flectobacillus roseus]